MKLFVRDQSFYRRVAAIGIPVILQSTITLGVTLMDTIMLSGMGEAQISASSLANQITSLFQIFCNGIGFGSAVLLAQYWGRQQISQMHKVIAIMLRCALATGVAVSLATALFPGLIMALFTSGEPEVVEAGVAYFTYLSPSYVFFGFSLTTTIAMRSVGQVRIPLISSIIAFFVNVFFNWVFIFGKLGAPRMEIAGAAVGTLIARLFEFLFICGYFLLREDRIAFRRGNLTAPCADMLPEFKRFSLPVVCSDTVLGLGHTMLTVIIGRMGKTFSAANAITQVLYRMINVAVLGLGNASSVITGNTIGRGEEEKAYEQGLTFLVIGVLLGLCATVIILLVSPVLTGYFQVTGETRAAATSQLAAMAVLAPFQTLAYLTTKGVLRGGGDTRFLMVADTLLLWCTSVPLGFLTGLVLGLDTFWVFIFLHVDFLAKAAVCTARFFSRKWIKVVQ